PARPHDYCRQPQGAAVDKALAAVIVYQQLADRLLGAIRGLRARRRAVADVRRQLAAVDRERTRKDQPRTGAERTAYLEHRAGAVEVHPVTEIGVGLGFTADDSGEVIDRVGPRRYRRRDRLAIGDVACQHRDALVVGQRQDRGRAVEQDEVVDVGALEQA